MRKFIVLFSIFLFGLILFDFRDKFIEPMCVINSVDSKKTPSDCQKITIFKNQKKSNELTSKIKNLLNKIKDQNKIADTHSKTIFSNALNIKKLDKVSKGEDTNKDEACAKYPEAC